MSASLGQKFCGNGDVLGFALAPRVPLKPSRGPTLTSSLANDQFSIQDVGYPVFVEWALEAVRSRAWSGALTKTVIKQLTRALLGKHQTNYSSEVARFLGTSGETPAVMPLCSMGAEPAVGRLFLNAREQLELDQPASAVAGYYGPLRAALRGVARTWKGRFVDLMTLFPGRISTVHPLGGCPMGATDQDGVVDSWGRVFGHPGLYVVDGSIFPSAAGINPSLTIAALAERAADSMIQEPR
jgi:cholesterol oxidase